MLVVSVVAHVDHGKTTLLDSILSYTQTISTISAGSLRYLDSRVDEQERGITLKLSFFQAKEFIFIDTPGHIDFESLIECSSLLCNSFIFIVDINEGITPRTLSLLNWMKNKSCILILNKIDKMINKEVHLISSQIIESMNVFLNGEYFTWEKNNIIVASSLSLYGINYKKFRKLKEKNTLKDALGFIYLISNQSTEVKSQRERLITFLESKNIKTRDLRELFPLSHTIFDSLETINTIGSEDIARERDFLENICKKSYSREDYVQSTTFLPINLKDSDGLKQYRCSGINWLAKSNISGEKLKCPTQKTSKDKYESEVDILNRRYHSQDEFCDEFSSQKEFLKAKKSEITIDKSSCKEISSSSGNISQQVAKDFDLIDEKFRTLGISDGKNFQKVSPSEGTGNKELEESQFELQEERTPGVHMDNHNDCSKTLKKMIIGVYPYSIQVNGERYSIVKLVEDLYDKTFLFCTNDFEEKMVQIKKIFVFKNDLLKQEKMAPAGALIAVQADILRNCILSNYPLHARPRIYSTRPFYIQTICSNDLIKQKIKTLSFYEPILRAKVNRYNQIELFCEGKMHFEKIAHDLQYDFQKVLNNNYLLEGPLKTKRMRFKELNLLCDIEMGPFDAVTNKIQIKVGDLHKDGAFSSENVLDKIYEDAQALCESKSVTFMTESTSEDSLDDSSFANQTLTKASLEKCSHTDKLLEKERQKNRPSTELSVKKESTQLQGSKIESKIHEHMKNNISKGKFQKKDSSERKSPKLQSDRNGVFHDGASEKNSAMNSATSTIFSGNQPDRISMNQRTTEITEDESPNRTDIGLSRKDEKLALINHISAIESFSNQELLYIEMKNAIKIFTRRGGILFHERIAYSAINVQISGCSSGNTLHTFCKFLKETYQATDPIPVLYYYNMSLFITEDLLGKCYKLLSRYKYKLISDNYDDRNKIFRIDFLLQKPLFNDFHDELKTVSKGVFSMSVREKGLLRFNDDDWSEFIEQEQKKRGLIENEIIVAEPEKQRTHKK